MSKVIGEVNNIIITEDETPVHDKVTVVLFRPMKSGDKREVFYNAKVFETTSGVMVSGLANAKCAGAHTSRYWPNALIKEVIRK